MWKNVKRKGIGESAGVGSEEFGSGASPPGLGCVANTGVTDSDFGSVAMIGLRKRFLGSVADKEVSGSGIGNEGWGLES